MLEDSKIKALFSCKESARLVSQSLDEQLTLPHRVWLGFHMAVCRYCRCYKNQTSQIRQFVRMDTSINIPLVRLTEDAKLRIKRKLLEENT
jgi:hypothetical protein